MRRGGEGDDGDLHPADRMIYARPIFSLFAGFFLLGLGIFSITQNPKSPTNRLFSIYTLCNLIWNLTDFIVFVPNLEVGLGLYHFTGFVACFITPSLLHFVFTVGQVSQARWAKTILKISYGLGIAVGALSLTPYVLSGIQYTPFQSTIMVEIPGPLYPVFAVFFFSVLFTCFLSASLMIRSRTGIIRNQMIYLMVAMVFGLLGLVFYLLSFTGKDWPWVYYPLQCISSVIFATAIFRFQLVPAKLLFRRVILILGIYSLMGMALTPLIFWLLNLSAGPAPLSLTAIILFTAVSGGLFSFGNWAYSLMVRRYSLFQENLASHLTHELKSPLAAIDGAKAVLLEEMKNLERDPQKIQDYIGIIERNTERLHGFVERVLDYNRIDENISETDITPVNLTSLWTDVLGDFPKQAPRITLISEGQETIKGSREGLKHIFTNLLSNAIKYCPAGSIRIEIRKKDAQWMMSVADNGAGIPKASLPRVFDPFYKTPGPEGARGSGLGLAIAKKWVEFHNGTIWAESEGEGKGTTVTFTLPA